MMATTSIMIAATLSIKNPKSTEKWPVVNQLTEVSRIGLPVLMKTLAKKLMAIPSMPPTKARATQWDFSPNRFPNNIRTAKDNKGRNILYKNNREERYPDFKLYKMIVRTVHNHLPEKQLEREIFKKFESSKRKIKKQKIINIDNMEPMV